QGEGFLVAGAGNLRPHRSNTCGDEAFLPEHSVVHVGDQARVLLTVGEAEAEVCWEKAGYGVPEPKPLLLAHVSELLLELPGEVLAFAPEEALCQARLPPGIVEDSQVTQGDSRAWMVLPDGVLTDR